MYITELRDSIGNKYYGFDIETETIEPYDNILENIIGDEYTKYRENKLRRDNDKYHITVLNVANYNRLLKSKIDFVHILQKDYDIELKGIGSIDNEDNSTYFIIVDCPELSMDLFKLGIAPIDFHITLAFKTKDIFNKRKNIPNIYDSNNS